MSRRGRVRAASYLAAHRRTVVVPDSSTQSLGSSQDKGEFPVHIGNYNRVCLVAALTGLSVLAGPSLVTAAPSTAQPSATRERMVVVPKTAADFDALRAQVQRAGGLIVKDLRSAGVLVVTGTAH